MVVRLKADQFTAGDMNFMVRSRRKARADPRFYGAGATEVKRVIKEGTEQNPTTTVISEEKLYQQYLNSPLYKKFMKEIMKRTQQEPQQDEEPSSNTVTTTKASAFKESDEYFNTEPVKQEEQEQSLEEQVREEPPDALHEKARKLLTEIEEDIKQMEKVKLEKESLKRSAKKKKELDFTIQKSLSLDI
jgi:hypothetical protein